MTEIGLDWLHARCAEVDGCLVWKLAAAHGTEPQARVGHLTVLVRRMVWELVNGRAFPCNHNARCTCGTDLCVHPDHIQPMSKSKIMVGKALPLTQRAKIAATKRSQSKLSDEAVALIRASKGPIEKVADEFGIDPTYVSQIRLGKARVDYVNPFAGLGARAA
jgi:hypothetical protein